ncbi:MAG: hypothetical protein Q8R15_04720 [Candidatus Micrarchaeota archaeon]|nr:hypothetical protein [Candidatus Micrarchaeota archaeon]
MDKIRKIGLLESSALVVKTLVRGYRLKSSRLTEQNAVKLADKVIPHVSTMFKALPLEKQREIAAFASAQLASRTSFGVNSVSHKGFLQALRFGRFAWNGGADKRLFPVLGDVSKKVAMEFVSHHKIAL